MIDDGKVIHRFETLPLLTVNATPRRSKNWRPATTSPTSAWTGSSSWRSRRPRRSSAPRVNARGVRSNGQTVAVIDTGVDRSHPFLAGQVVDEACSVAA